MYKLGEKPNTIRQISREPIKPPKPKTSSPNIKEGPASHHPEREDRARGTRTRTMREIIIPYTNVSITIAFNDTKSK